MKKSILFLTNFLIFCSICNYTNAQTYCIPPESTYGGPLTGFTKVSLGTLNNISGNEGYTDYTASVAAVSLAKNGSYTPSFIMYYDMIKTGFTDKVNLRIWIDYNKDGDFEDAGEQVLSMQTAPLPSTTNNSITGNSFTIPNTASLGNTRMRVYDDMVEADGHITPIPCGYLNSTNALGHHGEAEDYLVTITNLNGTEEINVVDNFNIFANAEGKLEINYDLINANNVVLDISNIAGQKLSTLVSEMQYTGHYEFLSDRNEMCTGLYFVSLRVGTKIFTQKVVF